MKIIVPAALVASILASPLLCGAQTDYSLRIRSLDVTFAGLLDDFLTDVYLNPARLSELDSSMVYAAKLPDRYLKGSFPTVARYSWDNSWVEDDYIDTIGSLEPVALSFLGVAGGKTAFSIAAEFGVDTREFWNDDLTTYPYADRASMTSDRDGGYNDFQRYEVQLAIAPVTTGAALGARVTGVFFDWSEAGSSIRNRLEWLYADASNPRQDYQSQYTERGSDRLDLGAEIGYSRPSGLLREIVAGAAYFEETEDNHFREFEFWDNDPDDNGVGYGGYPAESEYREDEYRNGREYAGVGGSLRCHLRWSHKLRSVHSAGYSRSTGDGSMDLMLEDGGSGSWETQGLSYDYRDGTLDRWFVQSSLGYHDILAGELLFAVGVDARYSRTAFDESASGEFFSQSSAGLEFGTPYEQRHDDVGESIRVALPVALEWPCCAYFTFRLGSAFYAARDESDRRLTASAMTLPEGPAVGPFGGSGFVDYDTDTSVGARFNAGLGFNLKDRLILDASTSGTYGVDLATYYEISAKLRF